MLLTMGAWRVVIAAESTASTILDMVISHQRSPTSLNRAASSCSYRLQAAERSVLQPTWERLGIAAVLTSEDTGALRNLHNAAGCISQV